MAPTPPPSEPVWPIPKLSLRVEDLAHPGVAIFLDSVNPLAAIRDAIIASFAWLYTVETAPRKFACLRHSSIRDTELMSPKAYNLLS